METPGAYFALELTLVKYTPDGELSRDGVRKVTRNEIVTHLIRTYEIDEQPSEHDLDVIVEVAHNHS